MTTEYVEVGDTAYFFFGLNDSAGADDADSTPTFDVREAGATASDAATLSGNCTLLTSTDFNNGSYEVAVACTSGNGFAADLTYGVFVTAVVNGTTYVSAVGKIKTSPLITEKDLGTVLNTTIGTVTSQTIYVLDAGSGDDDAYNNCQCTIEDSDGDTSTRYVTDYDGATTTVTINAGPDFTAAATDKFRVFANRAESVAAVASATATRIETDTQAIEADTQAIEVDTQDIQSRLPAALSGSGNMKSDVKEVNDITVTGSGTDGDPWGP